MCGIAGVFHHRAAARVSENLLQAMTDAIAHRGPDGFGHHVSPDGRIGLGHRRLSIIDVDGGAQPMSNAAGTLHIVFNGEIYNYRELRRELEGEGARFRSQSDTEVILALYERHGLDALPRLGGIFAFAIHDERRRTVTLARDHFGVKPLYYWADGGTIVFASEIKAVLASGLVPRALDLAALDAFLTFRYNPSPDTLLRGVRKLEPGHAVEVTLDGDLRHVGFVQPRPGVDDRITLDDAVAEYRRLLDAAVRKQLVSDVPVGLLLSGGLDSAVLGTLMQKHYGARIKTFTVGYRGTGDFNETDDARVTAGLIGSDHHEVLIDERDYLDYFFRSFETVEEPIAISSIPALYHVSKLAASHLKVVLAGQGADEPMAGYARYLGARFIGRYGAILRTLPLPAISKLLRRNGRLKQAAYASRFRDDFDRILAIYTVFKPAEKDALFRKDVRASVPHATYDRLRHLHAAAAPLPDLLSRMLFIDARMDLSDNLLLFNDKVTMANALEMRVPFLDLDLVNFLESLPASMKIRGFTRKFIHKKAAEAWLPASVIHRKKRGFVAPVDAWLRGGLARRSREILQDPASTSASLFDADAIGAMIAEHESGRENREKHILSLLSFEIWSQRFLKR